MNHGSLRLGRIAGVSVYAHWSTLATLAIFTWLLGTSVLPDESTGRSDGVTWLIATLAAVSLLASICAHELAHTIAARGRGMQVDRITLWLLGGLSELTDEPGNPKADLRIAVAGPIASAVAGSAFIAAAYLLDAVASRTIDVALVWLGLANISLAVFNLLPAAPLDGGRVLRAVVWKHTGDRLRAAAVAARTGRGLGLGLIVLGGAELLVWRNVSGLWPILLGWFLRNAAGAELAQASLRHRLEDLRVGDVMTEHPQTMAARQPASASLGDGESHSHQTVFAVVDEDFRPVGEVSLRELAKLAPALRDTVPVAKVARPLPGNAIAQRDDSLSAVATRALLRPGQDLIAVVDGDHRLVGVLTATDLARICDRTALGLVPVPRRRHRASGNGPQQSGR